MLAIGIAVGAAIGPGPSASLGAAGSLAARLPLLIAGVAEQRSTPSGTSTTSQATEPPPVTPQATPAAPSRQRAATPAASSSSEAQESTEAATKPNGKTKKAAAKKLPAITNVWLVELDGTGFQAAAAQPTAAPYLEQTLLSQGTLLSTWSAADASAFASEAILAEAPSAEATPPLQHTIVQPPCPEGAAGAACAPETPGALTAADEFLKATITTITSSSTYKEHGLVVITFASIGIATQSELPAGASTATLSYRPAAGALLLSPFAKAGARVAAAYDPASPRRSLEALLH